MPNKKAVLITGASSGIGKACALHLDQLGFTVYAGVRQPSDGDRLKAQSTERLKPILLDVTQADSIQRVVDTIAKDTDGRLFALINNAGIGRGGALEVTPVPEMKKLMDVNVIGLMAVTQAFIPMIRKSKGRILNIGSTASLLSVAGASVYSASKFAVRAITDALRLELRPFGIAVVLVAPGAVESPIWNKGRLYKEELRKTLSPEIADLYQPLARFGDRLTEEMKRIPASTVAELIADVLARRKPRPYYLVGKDAKGAAKAAKLPRGLLDWIILKHMKRLSQS
jgi:NAD(P)-dependent dehydrogenase (short-subunit alcohol dehydrogenase family)